MFPYLHTGNANAHGPNDPQVLLNEGLQLSDAATLEGNDGGGPCWARLPEDQSSLGLPLAEHPPTSTL